jgi:TPP-dependent pyruvate/acetoin dehydrogenase alpha subunit
LAQFEAKLLKQGWLKEAEVKARREQLTAEYLTLAQEVRQEALPSGETIYDNVYYGQKGRYW